MKILNLYAGIGGNRKLWTGCEVTAVENDPKIAAVYQGLFPDDTVFVGDAHQYLEDHFSEFGFIWASPPCQSHGQYRHNVGVIGKGFKPLMPDMRLYSEIVFLQTYHKGFWVVENTKPYYPPLINPSFELQRHLFWSNFSVPEKHFVSSKIREKNKITDYDDAGIVSASKITNKRQVLRNCVNPIIGVHILNAAITECFLNSEAD